MATYLSLFAAAGWRRGVLCGCDRLVVSASWALGFRSSVSRSSLAGAYWCPPTGRGWEELWPDPGRS